MLSVHVYEVTLVNESIQSFAPSVQYCALSSSFLYSLARRLVVLHLSLVPSHIFSSSSSEANQNLQKYAAYPPAPVVAHVGVCSVAGPSQRRSRAPWRSPSFSLSRSLRRPSDARATAEGASLPLFSPSRSGCSRAAATDVFAPLFCGGGGGGTAEASLSLRRNKREKILIPRLRLAETALT